MSICLGIHPPCIPVFHSGQVTRSRTHARTHTQQNDNQCAELMDRPMGYSDHVVHLISRLGTRDVPSSGRLARTNVRLACATESTGRAAGYRQSHATSDYDCIRRCVCARVCVGDRFSFISSYRCAMCNSELSSCGEVDYSQITPPRSDNTE